MQAQHVLLISGDMRKKKLHIEKTSYLCKHKRDLFFRQKHSLKTRADLTTVTQAFTLLCISFCFKMQYLKNWDWLIIKVAYKWVSAASKRFIYS